MEVDPAFNETSWVKLLKIIPSYDPVPNGWCEIAGWGITDLNGSASDVLLKTELPVWQKSQCAATYPIEFHSDTQMCAGRREGQGEADACVVCFLNKFYKFANCKN